MADISLTGTLTRRAALIGATVSSAAPALPTAAAVPHQMGVQQRMEHHFNGLAAAPAEAVAQSSDAGIWEIRVRSRNPELVLSRVRPSLDDFLKTCTVDDAAYIHARELAKTMRSVTPGQWRVEFMPKVGVVVAIHDRNGPGSGVVINTAKGITTKEGL